jgi:Secretion system C-terminal sorting domain
MLHNFTFTTIYCKHMAIQYRHIHEFLTVEHMNKKTKKIGLILCLLLSVSISITAQSEFFIRYTPTSPNLSISGRDITLQQNYPVVFVESDSIYFDSEGEEFEIENANINKYLPDGDLIWSQPVLSPPFYLPQINSDALIANDSFIYLSYNFFVDEFTQPGSIIKLDTLGQKIDSFVIAFDQDNEFYGNLYFYNDQLVSISEQRISSGSNFVAARIFSSDLELISDNVFDPRPDNEITTSFGTTLLNDKIQTYREFYNTNSTNNSLIVGSYDLTDQTYTELHTIAQSPTVSNLVIGNQVPDTTCILSKSTLNINDLTITRCFDTWNADGANTPITCETGTFLTFLFDGEYLSNGQFYVVGNIILDPNPTTNSTRSGYIKKYSANGEPLWQRYILDTLSYGSEPNSVTLTACFYDNHSGNLYVTGSSSTVIDNFPQNSLVLGVIDQNGCVNGACGDTIFIKPPTSNTSVLPNNPMHIQIFPNPTSGIIQIVNNNIHDFQPLIVQVTDARGRNLLTMNGENLQQVDITGFPAGVYFLKITSASGQVSIHKVIKTP